MRFTSALAAVGATFAGFSSAQQYLGEVIPNSLPFVPGSEITYFKIPGVLDKSKKTAANLTLINYYSHGKDNKRIVESKIKRAVIIIHGLNRDPGTYQSNMMSALAQVTDKSVNLDNVAIMSPYFPNGDDKNSGYPWNATADTQRSYTSALVWKGSQWSGGANNQYPTVSQNTSSYFVLDTLIKYFDDKTLFPNMNQIVVAGHSLGAQTVHRYAALGAQLGTSSPVTYWVANPNSFIWMDTSRPLSIANCPTYDYYRDGYTNFTEYPMTYGQSLVNQGRTAILANYNSKQIAYGRGTQDNGDDSSGCEPGTTGANRNERFFNFIKKFPISCPDPAGRNCDTVDFVNMGHDGGGMMASVGGRARLFTDNFNGTGVRAYDTGYPRQQAGDDPYPDPTLNGTSASVNNNTYAGNMTYAGCWSDSGSSRTLLYTAYDNSQNTIELCTSTCNSKGYTIAGMEFGSQCYCGNTLTSQATKVIESSCTNTCAANSTEICGGNNRLSIFSNGVPVISPPPSTPDTINDSWYTQGCYTEAAAGTRALGSKQTTSNSMTLETCATFCKGYKFFGTEYASECYCANSINSGASVAQAADCSMTCAGNPLEYCGAGNRLTVYQDTAYVAPTGSSTSSSTPGSTAAPGTGPSCPSSNGQTVISNGLSFTIECGIDHAGGDLTSATVANFQGCIDLCSANSQCVDVSLSGTACYLKKTLGGAVNAPAIWGAKLVTGGSVSSSSSSVSSVSSTSSASSASSVSSTVSGSSSSASSVSSTASASSTSTPLACPGSDATTYTAASGQQFLIECGVDHQGGDIASKNVADFQGCVDYCDQTAGCVDVSLSGYACYLKGTLGAALNAPAIWGAKAISSGSSSSSSSSPVVSTSSTTASGSSTTVSASSTTASASSTTASTVSSSTSSASASATPSAVSCPGSNGSTYTLASGSQYLIECGVDHQGGDLSSKTVGSFAECIALCDSTAKCVDVSLSGVACYLKSSVGAAVNIPQVYGAKLLVGSASTSSVASSTSSSSSVLQNVGSTTGTTTSSTDTSVPTTSSSSSTASSSIDTSVPSSTSSSATSSSVDTSVPSSTSSSTTSSSVDTTVPSSTSSSTTSSSVDTSVPTSTSSSSVSSTSSTVSVPSSTFSTSTVSSSSVASTTSTTLLTLTSSSTPSASSTSSTSAALPSGVSYLGCFIDGSTRALPVTNGTSSTQTPSQCALNCRAKGYKFSGTEYANECYCSNTAPTNQATADTQCNMNCAGDSTKKCGAGNRLSVYSDANWKQTFFATPSYNTWNLMGCYTDAAGARSLGTGVSLAAYGGANNATIANCVSACQAQGFTYCGAEYYSECYGSKTAPATSLAGGSDPLSAGCSYACKGNSTESCGGSNRIIIYTNNGTASA